MSGRNLCQILYGPRAPTSPALHLVDGTVLSTADLKAGVGRFAAALIDLGVRPGDRVSFKLAKCPEALMLAHACLAVGAVMHPLNTSYTAEETAFLLADAEPSLYVCEPGDAAAPGPRIETLADGFGGTLGALACDASPNFDPVAVGRDTVAALLYTSGTTGRPKGAQITHHNLAESARALAEVWQITERDVLLHVLPLYHAHGLLTSINAMLVGGGSILFQPGFEPAAALTGLKQSSVMMAVPTHYQRLLREPGLDQAIHPGFRLAISGSAPLPTELAERFARRTGLRLIERYGSTEAAIITAVPPGTEDRAGWVGWPLPGVEVRVACEDGSRHGRGATGVLETRGHNVFAGYWRRPDADATAFTADGWFISGDIAEIDAAGCVRLLGRTSDLIISGGLNVYPSEVERVLDAIPGIAQSAVFGVPHPDFGEAVVAAIEAEAGAAVTEAAVIASARQRLAPYKTPKRVVALSELPRNRMGKTLKAELRTAYRTLFDQASEIGKDG